MTMDENEQGVPLFSAGDEQDVPSEAPETTGTSAEAKKSKRSKSGLRRGERGRNQFPKDTYIITELSPKGEPLQPFEARPKFRNAVGFIVKEELDISWNGWKQVPGETRTKCWDRIVTRFIFPAPQVELAKKYFFQQMGISFRNWRYEMNVEWLQRGRDPTSHYKISAAQWERFRELKTTEEAKAKSKAASELAKRNKYAHHLGIGGYKAKELEWEREEAELRKKGATVLTDLVSSKGPLVG
jgi:hypothetical protein